MSVKKIILEAGYLPYYVCLVVGMGVLLKHSKGDVIIWLNSHHSPSLDLFFKYWTHLGDGLVFIILILILLMVSYFKAITVAVAGISQTLVVQILKRVAFSEADRPSIYLEHFDRLYQVPGVEIAGLYSFPSGHTASVFTVTVLLSIFIRNTYVTGLLMILAILVGISRIYLLQHFFVDIYFGSIIGFTNGILTYSWMNAGLFNSYHHLNRGLLRS